MIRLVIAGLLAFEAGAAADDDVVIDATLEAQNTHGLELSVDAGFHGVVLGVGIFGTRVTSIDDGSTYTSTGADLTVKLSVLGLALTEHRIEHWFDFGAIAGGGGGFTPSFSDPASYGEGFVGGWAQIGLMPGDAYPAVVLGARRVWAAQPWAAETLFTFGVGWFIRSENLNLGSSK